MPSRDDDSAKIFQRQIIHKALYGVTEIKPLIHRSKFSGDYNYGDVQEKLGKLKIDGVYGKKSREKNYTYKTKTFRSLPGGKITFFFNPQSPHPKPSCIAQTSTSTPEFLSNLCQSLPDLNIMSLEYAIDFYCCNQIAVSGLFYLLRRYLYIHHARRTSMTGGESTGYDGDNVTRRSNSVYKIHYKEKKSRGGGIISGKYVKIYERGEDNLKQYLPNGKKGWKHEDTNRVRLEVTISRKNRTLANNGIATLRDLLDGPKFQEIIFPKSIPGAKGLDQFQFRNFISRKPNILPKDHQAYLTEDRQGNIECFMNEYLAGKYLVTNIGRETENSKALEGLKSKMIEASMLFDQEWEKMVKSL